MWASFFDCSIDVGSYASIMFDLNKNTYIHKYILNKYNFFVSIPNSNPNSFIIRFVVTASREFSDEIKTPYRTRFNCKDNRRRGFFSLIK